MNIANVIKMAELETDSIGTLLTQSSTPQEADTKDQFFPHTTKDNQDNGGDHGID